MVTTSASGNQGGNDGSLWRLSKGTGNGLDNIAHGSLVSRGYRLAEG